MKNFSLTLAFVASLAVQSCAREQPPKPEQYICTRAKGEIKLDGKLDEPAWKSAAWTSDFGDVVKGAKVALQTRVKMLWDDENFYIAAELQEPNVRGAMREHDSA